MDIEQYSEIQHANGFPFLFHSIISKDQQHSCTLYGISSPSPLNWSVSVDCSLFKSLSYLQIIDFSYNRLSEGLSNFDKLPSTIRSVHISSNKFIGEIHFSFLEGSRFLVCLNASNNSFTGLANAFICSISLFLKFLDLSFNFFVGKMPKGFGECLNLLTLRASFNDLSGPLPEDIYNISTLRDLSLAANGLSGELDHRVSNLLELRILSLYGNELTGTIPENIGRLNKLENLLLHINQLNGTIQLSLANCSSLTILNLRVNNLGGELTAYNFSSLVRLRTIDLGDNSFTGSLPATLFSCKNLANIHLSNNSLQGGILPEIQAFESLSFLSLSRNNFTNVTQAIKILMGCQKLGALVLSKNFYGESLPKGNESSSGDDGFKEMRILALGGCGLRGELPRWVRKLGKLQVLDISYNQIRGSIPGWISELSNLFYLDMSYNLLSGGLPLELFRLQRFTADNNISIHLYQIYLELPIFVSPNNVFMYQYNLLSYLPGALYLDGNYLSGHLPTDIGISRLIQVLSLGNNSFSGNIPESISSITTLEKLDLSENDLSGEIPGSLKSLNFLSSFSVANNNLEGPVPTGGQFDTFTASSFEGNARLCGQILHRPCLNTTIATGDEPDALTLGKGSKQKIFVSSTFGFSFAVSFVVSLYYFLGSFSTSCARLIDACCQVKRRRSSIYVVETIM
ncbi:transmembrane signal receptor [Lithospermum erythrorhizon]|uniref:Transmembrane signal receptor n=1 Tax=Lithospermum erythrorhizon TaxID=34254 RepID=A0AAV3NK28_LITER